MHDLLRFRYYICKVVTKVLVLITELSWWLENLPKPCISHARVAAKRGEYSLEGFSMSSESSILRYPSNRRLIILFYFFTILKVRKTAKVYPHPIIFRWNAYKCRFWALLPSWSLENQDTAHINYFNRCFLHWIIDIQASLNKIGFLREIMA